MVNLYYVDYNSDALMCFSGHCMGAGIGVSNVTTYLRQKQGPSVRKTTVNALAVKTASRTLSTLSSNLRSTNNKAVVDVTNVRLKI